MGVGQKQWTVGSNGKHFTTELRLHKNYNTRKLWKGNSLMSGEVGMIQPVRQISRQNLYQNKSQDKMRDAFPQLKILLTKSW